MFIPNVKKTRNKQIILLFEFMIVAVFLAACRTTAPPPPPATTPATANSLPNRVVDGPLPGCADAIELVGQTLSVPASTITFDAGGVIDRVNVVATGVTYAFSTRPVNFDCSSTSLPSVSLPTSTFGFNYTGDFSRVDPVCMNASTITLMGFTVSGTLFDAAIALAAQGTIWVEVDRILASTMHPIVNGGDFPSGADPRCSNWVDLTTLPAPG